jgi:RHS repeat-associated protein
MQLASGVGGSSQTFVTRPLPSTANTSFTSEAAPPSFHGIACPSTGGCFAVGEASEGATIWYQSSGSLTNPGSEQWTEQLSLSATVTTESTFEAIACASKSFCVAVGGSSVLDNGEQDSSLAYETTNGGQSWTPDAISGGDLLTSVACPSTTFCVAAAHDGGSAPWQAMATGATAYVTVNSGQSWSASTYSSTAGLFLDVTCASTTVCFLPLLTSTTEDESPAFVPTELIEFDPTTGLWSATQTLPAGDQLTSNVACWSATGCDVMAQGTASMSLLTWNGAAGWSSSGSNLPDVADDFVYSLSCPSSSSCDGLGSVGGYNLAAGGPPVPNLFTTTNGGTNWAEPALPPSFAASNPVIAGGGNYDYTDGGWYGQIAVFCSTSTSSGCAIATSAGVVESEGTKWVSELYSPPGVQSVSCPGLLTCYAVADAGVEAAAVAVLRSTDAGAEWVPVGTVPAAVESSEAVLPSIGCTSVTQCFIDVPGVTTSIANVFYDSTNGGASWSSDGTLTMESVSMPTEASCSPTLCVFGMGSALLEVGPATQPAVVAIAPGALTVGPPSCTVITNECVVVVYSSSTDSTALFVSTDGGNTWSDTYTDVPAVNDFGYLAQMPAVTCPTTTECLLTDVGNDGTGLSYTAVQSSTSNWTWTETTAPGDLASQQVGCVTSTICWQEGTGLLPGSSSLEGVYFSETTNAGASWSPTQLAPDPLDYELGGLDCDWDVACFFAGTTNQQLGPAIESTTGFSPPDGGPLTLGELLGGFNPAEGCLACELSSLGLEQLVGDPVNTATGDLSESASDISIPTYGPALSFVRTYDAAAAQQQTNAGQMGFGWTDNWATSAVPNDPAENDVTVVESNGSQVTFYPYGTSCPIAGQLAPGSGSNHGTYCVAPRVQAYLTMSGSDYVFSLQDGTSYTYSSVGAFVDETSPTGLSVSIAAGATTCPAPAVSCETIMAADGAQSIVLGFSLASQAGQIVTASDPLGRTWTYRYCQTNSSTCLVGDLVSAKDPMGRITTYTYDAGDSNTLLRNDLTSVTSPRFVADVPTASQISSFCSGGAAPGDATVDCYDSFGRVIEQGDPMGRLTTYAYEGDALGSTGGSTVVTDPDGNETLYSYVYGELLSTTTSYGTSAAASWSYFRDPATLLATAVVNPHGGVTTMSYTDGDVTSLTNQIDETTTYTDNRFGEATCVALPEAISTCQNLSPPTDIDPGSAFTAPTAPAAYVTYSQYDTDADLVWTSTGEYSPSGTLLSLSTSYDLRYSQSVIVAGTDYSCAASAPANSGLTCATVDPGAYDTQKTNQQAITQLGYDTDGDLASTSITDGNSGGETATTTSSYDADGEVQSVVSPLGNLDGGENGPSYTTSYFYNADDEVTEVAQATGSSERKTYYGYDADGNVTSLENPLTGTTSTTFDADEEATFVTDPDGNSTLHCYDADGNVTEVVPPVGVALKSLTATSCPSPLSDPTSESNAAAEALAVDATLYSYDALRDTIDVYSPAPQGQTGWETTASTYAPDQQLLETVAPPTDPTNDPGGVVTLDTYDAADELVASSTGTGSSLAVTSYCYDPDGNETAVVPPDGNTGASVEPGGLILTGYASCSSSSPYETTSPYQTGYTHDSTGNLLTRTRPATAAAPSGATTTDTYDASDQLATTTSPKNVTTTLTYTPLGEVATETYSDGTHSVTNTWNANGQNTKMVDGTLTSTTTYDVFGDVRTYTNGAQEEVSYVDNALGEPLSITYPLPTGTTWDTSSSASYTYDDAGLLKKVTDLEGNSISYTYTADELAKTITFPSAVGSESLGYDNADNAQSIVFTKGSSSLSYSYTREPSGDIAAETDSQTGTDASPSYNYDSVDRVTKLTPGSGSATSYGYDASSNLTTLLGVASAAYDDSSELCWTSATSSTNACSSPPTGSVSYSYDADGNRLSATQGSSTLDSASWNGIDELSTYDNHSAGDMTAATDDGNGLRESDTVSSVAQDFVWDTATSLPELLEDGTNLYIYGPSGTPIEQMSLSSGTSDYLISDALGSVRGVVSSAGILAWTSYDAYGKAGSTAVVADTPFGFAGGYTDGTGLVYLLNRYYDPATGQFISVDPIVDETDQPYVYTGGDPVINSDPSGLTDVPAEGAIEEDELIAATEFYDQEADQIAEADAALGVNDPIGRPQAEVPTGNPVTGENLVEAGNGEYCPLASQAATDEAARAAEDAGDLGASDGLNVIESSGRTFVGTPRGTVYDIPEGWVGRTADNGQGIVFQEPGAVGNADSIRIMDPTAQYSDGYVRYYNDQGQPLDVNGKPGPPSATHISQTYQGPWSGWP